MGKNHRQYNNEFPSVTTVISLLANYGLMEWFKRTPYSQILEESNRGKQTGTDIHNAIQLYIETNVAKVETENPDEVTNALKSFMLFKKENPDIILKRSEIALTSTKYHFNGQVDALAEIDGKEVLLDWKSGKKSKSDKPSIYDSYKTQCSAYCHLMGLDRAIIVAIAKDGIAYNKYEMGKEEIDNEFNEVFLPLLKIWRYRNAKRFNGVPEGASAL